MQLREAWGAGLSVRGTRDRVEVCCWVLCLLSAAAHGALLYTAGCQAYQVAAAVVLKGLGPGVGWSSGAGGRALQG
jgi:hypothetical protein